MLNLVKTVLWCALRASTLLESLYSLLGSTIAACDEYIWRHHAKVQSKRWQDWMDEHDWGVRAAEECVRLGITDEETRAFVFDHERNHATFIKPRPWPTEE